MRVYLVTAKLKGVSSPLSREKYVKFRCSPLVNVRENKEKKKKTSNSSSLELSGLSHFFQYFVQFCTVIDDFLN